MKDYYLQYDDKNGAINHIITNALRCYFEYEYHYDLLIKSIYGFICDDFERLHCETFNDVLRIIESSSYFTARAIPIIAGLYFDIYRYIKSKTLFESSKQIIYINDEKDNIHFINLLIFSARYSILTCDSDTSIGSFIISNYKIFSNLNKTKLTLELADALKDYVLEYGYHSDTIRFWLKIYALLSSNF